MNTKAFHTLEGINIRFKQVSIADAPAMYSYLSDIDVSRYIGWSLMQSVYETCQHIEKLQKREAEETHLYASVVDKLTNMVIGNVMLFNFDCEANHAEIGYVLHKGTWGQGIGTQCVKLINDFARNILQLHKLYAHVVDVNIGSARILEKNGYNLEGRLKDHYFIDDRYYDSLMYGKIIV